VSQLEKQVEEVKKNSSEDASKMYAKYKELLVENDHLQYQVIHIEYDEISNEFSYFHKRKDDSRDEAKPLYYMNLEVEDKTTVDELEVTMPRLIKSIKSAHDEGYI